MFCFYQFWRSINNQFFFWVHFVRVNNRCLPCMDWMPRIPNYGTSGYGTWPSASWTGLLTGRRRRMRSLLVMTTFPLPCPSPTLRPATNRQPFTAPSAIESSSANASGKNISRAPGTARWSSAAAGAPSSGNRIDLLRTPNEPTDEKKERRKRKREGRIEEIRNCFVPLRGIHVKTKDGPLIRVVILWNFFWWEVECDLLLCTINRPHRSREGERKEKAKKTCYSWIVGSVTARWR